MAHAMDGDARRAVRERGDRCGEAEERRASCVLSRRCYKARVELNENFYVVYSALISTYL